MILADITTGEFLTLMGSIVIPVLIAVGGAAFFIGNKLKNNTPSESSGACRFNDDDETRLRNLDDSHHGPNARDEDGGLKWRNKKSVEKATLEMVNLQQQSVRLLKENLDETKRGRRYLRRLLHHLNPDASGTTDAIDD